MLERVDFGGGHEAIPQRLLPTSDENDGGERQEEQPLANQVDHTISDDSTADPEWSVEKARNDPEAWRWEHYQQHLHRNLTGHTPDRFAILASPPWWSSFR